MAEREGLEPALRAHKGKSPCVPLLKNAGELPRTPNVSNLEYFKFCFAKHGGEGGIRTLERVLPLQRFSKPSP
jgi:hypothetical protein